MTNNPTGAAGLQALQEAELKKCPFCGCGARVWPYNPDYIVECVNFCCETTTYPTEAEAIAAWNRRTPDASLTQEREAREAATLQARVAPWMQACFGPEISADTTERNHRFLEESLELVQACGCTEDEAHRLVDYVFNRAVGEKPQEVGGVMITLAALCLAQGLDMDSAGETELERIWTKIDVIRAKQAAKPRNSPLPESAESSVDTLRAALASKEAEVEGLKAEHKADIKSISDDYRQRISDLCDYAWQRVYGELATDWEYPAQAIRHLVTFCDEKDKEIAALSSSLAAAQATATKEAIENVIALIETNIKECKEVWGKVRIPDPEHPGWLRILVMEYLVKQIRGLLPAAPKEEVRE